MLQLFGAEEPGIAFCGEDGRTGGVERAQGLHEGWIVFGFGEVVEVVGVSRRSMKRGPWMGSVVSDQGTSRRGSSGVHSADHSANIQYYLAWAPVADRCFVWSWLSSDWTLVGQF